ncbi:MAG TPA: hypothetical protein PK122_06710 [Candidatus Paceibacterota bacterium]|nr:hypothetical protein [Candidatus Paceibacterota bacterium]
MPKKDDIWIPESIFENSEFWKLTPLKYKILLAYYEENEKSITDLHRKVGYVGKRRTVSLAKIKKSLDELKGFFFTDDLELKYTNRIGKAEFIKIQKEAGKPDHLIRESWKVYVKNTDNPIRMRRDTYDFIFNNSITSLQMKCILYVLRAYKNQNTKYYTRRYIEIAKIFGMNTDRGTYINDISNGFTFVLININNGFLKSVEDLKLPGKRGKALKIIIRD